MLVQESADVTDYYYYSAYLSGGVTVAGVPVNLHIAVRGSAASVGSPLIFGGY